MTPSLSKFGRETHKGIAPNILGLTLMPTEQCCFRCDYCYEDFEIGKMPTAVQNGTVNLLKQRAPTLDALSISWFGGEPLMAKDIIYKLSREIVNLAERYGISYNAHMTTNAYLLDQECYEKLVKLGVSGYQITLDGPEAIHDKVRKRVDGKGTFAVIMDNLRAIKASDAQAQIMLRIHYKPDTWKAVLSLIDDLKRELLDDPRFTVIFRAVGKWGGSNDADLNVFDHEIDKQYVETRLVSRLFGSVPELPPEAANDFYICYASKANNMVIRADGGIAKCTVALSHTHNDVGRLNEDGTLTIHQEYFKKWLIGFQTGDLKQLACPASSALKSESNTLKSIPVTSVMA